MQEETTPGSGATTRSRDADRTRALLLDAARRRFAHDGYSATTVRDIARDAGVNVALINRYFASKEGLFEACLSRAVADLDRSEETRTFDEMVDDLIAQVSAEPTDDRSLQLMLLLRSSGDEHADRIRQQTVHRFTERLAAMAGWAADDPTTAHLLLRAQIAIGTAFGIVLLQSATGLEPLTSAAEGDLHAPLNDVFRSLLAP